MMAIELGIVSHEMLDGCADALALNAIDITHSDARGEKGIFAKVFKVSSIHRRAIDVHARAQQKMHSLSPRISANFASHALGQRRIPGSSQSNAARHRRGRPIIPHADWTISHLQTRDAKPRHATNKKTVDSSKQINLFLERHLLENRLDFVFSISVHGSERLRLHVNEGQRANQRNDQNGG